MTEGGQAPVSPHLSYNNVSLAGAGTRNLIVKGALASDTQDSI
jgi:hypothetical protein